VNRCGEEEDEEEDEEEAEGDRNSLIQKLKRSRADKWTTPTPVISCIRMHLHHKVVRCQIVVRSLSHGSAPSSLDT
jgi:hypothetical protein